MPSPGGDPEGNPGICTRDDWNYEEWSRARAASEPTMSPDDAKTAEAAEWSAIDIPDYEKPANQRRSKHFPPPPFAQFLKCYAWLNHHDIA